MQDHQRVVNLSAQADLAKAVAFVLIHLTHRLQTTVSNSRLGLEAVGLIEQLRTPLSQQPNLSAEAVGHSPVVVSHLLPNRLMPFRYPWIGDCCVGFYQWHGIRLTYLVLKRKAPIFHVVVKAVVRLLACLADRHYTG